MWDRQLSEVEIDKLDTLINLLICIFVRAGKKQDVWFVVDPETGEKQTSLTTSSSESICPNSPLLYIGRTGLSHTSEVLSSTSAVSS